MNQKLMIRRLTSLAVGISLLVPVGANAASPSPVGSANDGQTSQDASRDSAFRSLNGSEGGGEEFDGSTNCDGDAVPFITGTVRDAAGIPVGGARVNVTTLGLSFPNPATNGPFQMWETKADGTYSICTWEGQSIQEIVEQDQNLSNALLAIASPPENSAGTTQGSQITLMTSFRSSNQQGQLVRNTVSNLSRSNECLDPAVNATKACRMDFVLGTPIVTAKIQQSNGDAISNAKTTLEFFFRPSPSPTLTENQRNALGKWVQLGVISANSTGHVGISGFSSSNKFRLKVQPPECYAENEQSCPFDGLGNQSDNFSVTVTDPINFATTGSAKWELNETSSRDFTLVQANLRGQITDGLGNNVKGIVDLNIVGSTKSMSESTQYGGRFALTLADGTWSVELVAPSYGVLGRNATYSMTVTGGSVTTISRSTAPTGIICADATACVDNLKLQLTPLNFIFTLKDTDGKVVEGSNLFLEEYSPTTSPYPWIRTGNQQSGTANYGQISGLGGFELDSGKIYRINIDAPYRGNPDLVRTEYLLKVSEDGSAIRRCSTWNNNPQTSPCESGWTGDLSGAANLLTKVDDRFTLTMAVANFRGFVCAPGEGSACTVVPYADVDVSRWQTSNCQGCTGYYQGFGMYAWSGQSGTIALSFTTEGRYRMQVRPPRNRPEATDSPLYASNNVEFYADQVGSEWKFFTLDANGAATTTELLTATVESLTRVALRLKTPSFVGAVRAPSGAANTYSWVEIRKETPTVNCPSCSEWLGGANTDSNGVFALSLEVGKYTMTANPNVALVSEGLTRTEFKFSALDCDTNGVVEIYTYSSVDCSSKTLIPVIEGKIVITLQGANFTGVLKRPDNDQVVPSAGIDVERWAVCAENVPCPSNGSGYWTWAGINSFTNQSGRFAFRLNEVGLYRVTFRPPSSLQSQLSSSRIEVQVSAGDPLVVDATADASLFTYNSTSNEYSVKLKLPNVAGTVTLPFDGADDGIANDPAANTWINLEKWGTSFCLDGCYQWTSDVSGANTNNNGVFGVTLPAGRWRLTFNPPWGISGAAKATREIVVTSSGTVCSLATSGSEGTTCLGTTIAAGDFDVELPSPNFSGTVKNPDASVSQWSSIQFQKWESSFSWWQGTNIWANTDNNGKFGVNLTEDGSYRVTFEPSWQAIGLSGTTIYIRVCDDGAVVQLVANETAAKSGTTCTSSDTLGNPSTVYTLVGANMQGVIKDGSNSSATLGDAWVTVLNCGIGGTNDMCMWERGVNSKGFGVDKGKFALNLIHTSDGSATKYRIEVNPPWNTTAGLVRGQYDVWVKDFDASSPGDEWCLAANFNADDATCTDARKSSSPEWEVTLSAGNLAGKLLSPDGATGIAHGWMQVEKWTLQPWNTSSYHWRWTNYWVNTNQTGSFGLNIPGSDAGLFRLTANPGWDNPNGFARSRMFIRVASDGEWCEQIVNPSLANDVTPYGTDGSGTECTKGTDNAVDSVTGLTVKLSTSNLSGTLYTSSTDLDSTVALETSTNKVRDAWMSLQVKRTESGGAWTYWEGLGGSNTSGSNSSRGKFGFVIEENGDYRVDVQPSWRDTSGLDGQFYIEFTATSCGDGDGCSIALTGTPDNVRALNGGMYTVKYPPPNFKGIVKDKTSMTAVAGSWISIYKSNREWVTGISTGWNGVNAGKFGTKLEDGSYRVEVWPRWDDATSGMRRVISLVVGGGVVTSCSPGCDLTNPSDLTDVSRTLTLKGENLSGKVYFPGATDGTDNYALSTTGNQTPMPWAGVEVRTCSDEAGTQCDTWIDSQSSNESGLLRLGLDPRQEPNLPYLVTVWPNWSYFSASPLRLLVQVDSDSVATWKYETENDGYVGIGNAFNTDFGRIPPNLSVTVTGVDTQRFVKLYQCVGGTVNGNCEDGVWSEVITIGTVKATGTWKASFTVTDAADYKVVALRTEEDVAATGTLVGATSVFSHVGSTLQEQTIEVRPPL